MSIDIDSYYRRYAPMVMRRCRKILHDEDAAADAMQDTFLRLINSQDRIHDESPSSLLYTIATNVCLNRIRANQRRRVDSIGDEVDRLVYNDNYPERINDEALLEQVIGSLPNGTREVARDYYVSGKSLEETALHRDLSISGVRKRLQRIPAVFARFTEVPSAARSTTGVL